ncbi:hypothetical protein KAU39_00465 [bacterium]|nr:hypothetical protein [bacterium]
MNKKSIILISLISGFIFQPVLFAGDNPFVSGSPDTKAVKAVRYPGFMQKIMIKIVPLQQKLSAKLTKLIREIKNTGSGRALCIIILISFLYGFIHALGPGHGKTITFSYFLAKQADIKKGIIVGSLIAFLHVFSALVIVLILYLIVQQAYLISFENLSRTIKLISYALIALIGLFLLIKAFIDLGKFIDLRKRKKNSVLEEDISYSKINTKNIIPVAFAVGMIPCPGAVIILLFSISMDVLKVGVISIFSMAMGMAVTISLVGVLTIVSKRGVLKFIAGKSKVRDIFQISTQIFGSLFILFLGIILFVSFL